MTIAGVSRETGAEIMGSYRTFVSTFAAGTGLMPSGVYLNAAYSRGLTDLTFSLHIHNLFNHKYYADAWLWRAYFQQDDLYYAETGLYPQAPANFMFKVAYRF